VSFMGRGVEVESITTAGVTLPLLLKRIMLSYHKLFRT
jgi:hypothetical protein